MIDRNTNDIFLFKEYQELQLSIPLGIQYRLQNACCATYPPPSASPPNLNKLQNVCNAVRAVIIAQFCISIKTYQQKCLNNAKAVTLITLNPH